MDERKTAARRSAIVIAAAAVVMALYLLRMVHLQLVNNDYYLAKATKTTTYPRTVTAARGEIVDCYGRSIATNVTCYDLIVDKLLLGDADLNQTLKELVEILQESGEAWNDQILVSAPDESGHYTFTDDPDSTSDQRKLSTLKENLELQQYATADNVMAVLVEEYDLQDETPQWQRILAGIRYQMKQEGFSNRNTFTLAENVSDRTVATIRERSLTLSGADITESSVRDYPDGTVLSHSLGRVSKITAEQWKVTDEDGNVTYPLRDKGYAMNDVIGAGGLEAAYEDVLRGTDGEVEITLDASGVITDETVTTAAQPGLTVMTTIDSDFQKKVQQHLEEAILKISSTHTETTGGKANAGAVVVLSTKDNSVLAACNYPTYDLNGNYNDYLADTEAKPLLNRAFGGLYTPGSTFKPATSIAALLSGNVTADEKIKCTGTYTYYTGYSPRCAGGSGHTGSYLTVADALKYSCNIYYYEVGRRTTSDVYNAYAQRLGLATKTGLEVYEETGRLTTKEDAGYTASLDIQAAIGQGNTLVTPVQLATYASTIANRGVRYRTHLVKALVDTNTGEMVQETVPEVVEIIEDEIGAFDAVEEGMVRAGANTSYISTYPYTIAVKTGSPQRNESYMLGSTKKYYTNTMMIAYGPVEDPQIAVAIVIEYGGGGARAAELLTQIFDAYFFEQSGSMTAAEENTLLE